MHRAAAAGAAGRSVVAAFVNDWPA